MDSMRLPIKVELPARFLEREVRCGYEVPEKLKKIWAVELDLLAEFDRVCKLHGIKYQVFAGTLLGAVRHKGMIPWDDDIDVAMSRGDFNKLCAIASNEFTDPYFFQTALNDRKYFLGFARLRNSLTTGVIRGYESSDYNNGIYIDIFPLDGLHHSKLFNRLQTILMTMFVKCCTTYIRERRKSNRPSELISRMMRPLLRLLPYEFWVVVYNKVLSMWTNNSDIVAMRTHFVFGERYFMHKKDLFDTIRLPFEFLSVPAPRMYDEVLSGIYGEYMKFPPPGEIGKWHEGQIVFDPDIPYKEFLLRHAETRK